MAPKLGRKTHTVLVLMTKSKSKKSEMMTSLYGEKYSQRVYERLEELDPELNRIIQSVAYDQGWGKDGLSIRDKSLITVVALIAMGREEQTKIHMNGFLNCGGKVEDLRNSLLHLHIYCGFPAVMNGFAALTAVLKDRVVDNKTLLSTDLESDEALLKHEL